MARSRRLPRSFYARPAEALARDLLGLFLVRRVRAGSTGEAGEAAKGEAAKGEAAKGEAARGEARVAGRIVEVEAYVGPHDLACHAAKGLTGRTRVMFGPPGHAYVYLIYGRSHCFNVVCEREGFPAAVLVRALEPAEGVTVPTDGPGKLSRALGIDMDDNTRDLTGDTLWLEERPGAAAAPIELVATPRIGIDYAGEWVGAPLRFVDGRSAWLSKRVPGSPRPSARAPLIAPAAAPHATQGRPGALVRGRVDAARRRS